ncbi:MAG: hypothetical protein WKG01_38425 [Kofleriaceae bacterium]
MEEDANKPPGGPSGDNDNEINNETSVIDLDAVMVELDPRPAPVPPPLPPARPPVPNRGLDQLKAKLARSKPKPEEATAPAAPTVFPGTARPVPAPPTPPIAAKPVVRETAPMPAPSRPPAPPSDVATTPDARLAREADALAASFPTRAALVQAFRARIAIDLAGDTAAATLACGRAAELAPDARFVVATRRWIAGRNHDRAGVAAAARAEIPLAGDATERVALLWQIAHAEASDPERTLRQILELDAHDLAAWLALAASAMQRKQHKIAVEAWEAAAVHTEDLLARAAFYACAAGVRQASLGDDDGARDDLDRAFDADPTSIAALAGLESIHLRSRKHAEHARMVALEALRVGDLDPALGYHERAGELYWEGLRDANAAAQSFERAARIDVAGSMSSLGKLASLYEQEGRHAQVVEVYERLLGQIIDPVRRGAVLLRLGTLYEDRLDRPDDALRCYRAALEVAPTLAPAAQALARVYQARKRWNDVANVLLVEVERLTDPALRAARYVAIAELLESHLGPSAQVIGLHERALALHPAQAASVDALDRIHRANDRWDEVIALHEAQLGTTAHPMRKRALHLALAALYQDRAAAPDKAADHLRAAMAGPPDQFPALVSLARALADAGKWAEQVSVLERQAELLRDGPELVATLHRIATVIEHRLEDPARALAAYARLLEREPRHELAVQAMLRIHVAQARWEDVITSERKLLEITERPEEAAIILHRIGHVAEDKLARPDEAITAYETALVYVPTDRPARVALERLLRLGGKFERLAGLLIEQASDATTAGDRARLLAQAALVREMHLETSDAAKLYAEALALEPAMPTALWGLQRLQILAADWTAVVETLGLVLQRAEHPKTRARLLVQLARIHELRLADPVRAAELYQHALTTDPQPAIVFERLRVALAYPAQPADEPGRWLAEAARSTTDPHLASGLLRLRAFALDVPEAADAASEAYADALQVGSTPEVLEGLARTRRGAPLAEALALRAGQLKDAAARALLHAVAGALHEQDDAADRAYREALAAQPEFFPALEGRRRLAERAGDWKSAAAICAEAARVACHPANKLELLEAAAAIVVERLADPERAIALYRDVLVVAPGRAVTIDRALELFVARGDWNDAATLIAEQAPHLDPGPRATLLARRAQILAERLGDGDGAIADLERALAILPAHPQLLANLAELHESLRHWADAARAYEELARNGDPDQRRAALLGQARIWTTEVPDYARAQRLLEEASALAPDRTIKLRLAEVARLAGDPRRAAEQYLELSRHGTPSERATALFAHVELLGQLGEDRPDAMAAGFELAIEDPEVLPMLEDHYRTRANLAGFVAHAEAALARTLPSHPGVIPLRVALGRIFGRELSAPERAIPYLQAAVAAAPANAQLRVTFATALATRDDQAAITELRKAVELDPLETAAYQRLAQICARQGREGIASLLDTAAALVGPDDTLAQAQRSYVTIPTPVPDALRADDALAILVGKTGVADVRTVVAHLDPFLHEIFPDAQKELHTLAPLPERYPITGAIRAIALGLGLPLVNLYWRERTEPVLLASDPRAFVISPEHVTEQAATRIRFDAAYALARLAGGSVLGHVLPAEEVRALLHAISDPDADDADGYRRRVPQAMPRRARKDLERLLEDIGVVDPRATTAWEGEERRRALGIGVITCGDLRAVARSACPEVFTGASAEDRRAKLRANLLIVEALRFVTTDACWTASKRLYGRA